MKNKKLVVMAMTSLFLSPLVVSMTGCKKSAEHNVEWYLKNELATNKRLAQCNLLSKTEWEETEDCSNAEHAYYELRMLSTAGYKCWGDVNNTDVACVEMALKERGAK